MWLNAEPANAVAVAEHFNMTLVGFLRDTRFNVYAGVERILGGRSINNNVLYPALRRFGEQVMPAFR